MVGFITKNKTKMQKFFNGVKSIKNKNAGGCLFFCYAFWKFLEKENLPTDTFQIVQYDYADLRYTEHNLKFINGEIAYATSSRHFTWMYEGVEYDGYGKVVEVQFGLRTVLNGLQNEFENLVDKFCESALINGNWNETFNREKAIDLIYENLKIDLNSILL